MPCQRWAVARQLLLAGSLLLVWPAAYATPPRPLQATDPAGRPVSLPDPAAQVGDLLRRGNVRFTLYDPQRDPQPYAGLTRFDLQYRFEATSRWQVRRIDDRRELHIHPRLDQLRLEFRHEILLPHSVLGDAFFDHPLVRHELDHVRISTDPRLEERFQRWLDQDLRALTMPLKASQRPDDALVRRHVEQAIEQIFERLIDMVRIRYDELDRQTDHGQQPLPAGLLERLRRRGPTCAPAAAGGSSAALPALQP